MGKSPGKWIKTVLFGKKSSKSNLSKDATLDKKISITAKSQSKDFGADPMVISSPVRSVINVSGEHVELEKSSSANLMCGTVENVTSTMELNAANDDELIRLEQAATKAQAAFRGYLARRAFWALKGIIRLQALVRGHLVRRQAVATLSCMRAIVEFQALVRGQRVRLSWNGPQVLLNNTSGELLHKKRADLLGTSLRSEKLSTNAFATKLVASSNTTMPLSIQYDPNDPNSVCNWLERWSSSHFWEPLPRPKKTLVPKPKRKQTKLQSEDTETTRPKRSVRKIPTARKISTHQAEPVQEQPHNELEKVKRSLRKISVSTTNASGKPEIATEKLPEISTEKLQEISTEKLLEVSNEKLPEISTEKLPEVSNEKLPEISTEKLPEIATEKLLASLDKNEWAPDQPFEKVNEPEPEPERLDPEAHPGAPLEDEPLDFNLPVEPPVEKVENEPALNVESNGKENQKTRRRKSFPVKQEYPESVSQNTPALPSYMAATESAKAKLRAQAVAKAAEDGGENGFIRRHSLPSSTGKLSLQLPRVQKPLQANGKGGSKSNKLQISPRDEKVLSAGWRR